MNWQPEVHFNELVKMMVDEDIKLVERDCLCKEHGVLSNSHFE